MYSDRGDIMTRATSLLKKTLSLFISILFTFNSVSFAQPAATHTLRAEAAALRVSADIEATLKASNMPFSAYENPPVNIQPLVREFAAKDISPIIKASSTGIDIKVSSIPKIDLDYNANTGDAVSLFAGPRGIRNKTQPDMAFSILVLSVFGRGNISESGLSDIISFLNGSDGINSSYAWKRAFSVLALRILDKGKVPEETLLEAITFFEGKSNESMESNTLFIRAFSVAALSILDKDKIDEDALAKVIDYLIGPLAIKSNDRWKKSFSVMILGMIGKDNITGDTSEKAIEFFEGREGIKSRDSRERAFSTLALSMLSEDRVTEQVLADAIAYFAGPHGIENSYDMDIGFSTAALYVLTKKTNLYKIKIAYTGLDKSVSVYAKDAFEISDKLKPLLEEMGIKTQPSSAAEIIFSAYVDQAASIVRKVDISQKDQLDKALTGFIALKRFLSDESVKPSSSGVSVRVNRFNTDSSGPRSAIDFLTGAHGLKSQDPETSLRAAITLSMFDKELINAYAEDIIGILTGYYGIKNTSPIKKIEAQEALIRLDKDVFNRFAAVDKKLLHDFAGMDGLSNATPLVKIYAARLLSRYDKEALVAYIDIIMPLLTGRDGFKNSNNLIRIEAARAMSEFDKDIVEGYIDLGEVVTFLTGPEALKNPDPLTRIRSAVALAGFDKDTALAYADEIIPALTGGRWLCLRGLSLLTKAEIIDALYLFDEEVISDYLSRIIINLTGDRALKSPDPWADAHMEAVLRMLDKKYAPALTVVAHYRGLAEPVMISARHVQELKDMLNRHIFGNSGVVCDINSQGVMEFYCKDNAVRFIASAESESALKRALENAIRYMLYIKTGRSVDIISSTGAFDDLGKLNPDTVKEAVEKLLEQLKSRDLWTKVFAAGALSELDKEVIAPYLKKYLPERIRQRKEDMDKEYLGIALENNADFWRNYYYVNEEYYNNAVRIMHKAGPYDDSVSMDKASSSGMISRLVDNLHRAVDRFLDTAPQEANRYALKKFEDEIQGIKSNFEKRCYSSVNADSMAFSFKVLINEIRWILNGSKNAASASEGFDKIMADKFKNIRPASYTAGTQEFLATIILNENDVPQDQGMLLRLLSRPSPYREELSRRLGVNIVLSNDFRPAEDRTEHMVIISGSRIDLEGAEDARYLSLQPKAIDCEDDFTQIMSAVVFAKGLILFTITKSPDVEEELKLFYQKLTQELLSSRMLYDFTKPSGRFILLLPKAEPVDKDYFDTLQKISLQAFIAA